MQTCSTCNGKGTIETIEDKLREVMSPLYRHVEIKPNTMPIGNDYVLKLDGHTSLNGGEDGDIITSKQIKLFKKLGYYVSSVGQTYVYVCKI